MLYYLIPKSQNQEWQEGSLKETIQNSPIRWPGGIKHSFPLHKGDMNLFTPEIVIWLFSGEQIFISPLCKRNKCILIHINRVLLKINVINRRLLKIDYKRHNFCLEIKPTKIYLSCSLWLTGWHQNLTLNTKKNSNNVVWMLIRTIIRGPITVSSQYPHISLGRSQNRLNVYFCSQHILWYLESDINLFWKFNME